MSAASGSPRRGREPRATGSAQGRVRFGKLAIAALASGCVSAAPAPATRSWSAPTGMPATAGMLRQAVLDRRILGAVAALGRGSAPPAFVAVGRARLDTAAPPTPDTLWRIYSMTKPITGVAAMILVQEGRLRLDEPIADVLPAYRNMRVLVGTSDLRSRPATHQITIRELLTHTSGLTYAFAPTRPIDREYFRLGLVPYAFDPAGERSARSKRPRTLQAFAERVASVPLVSDPGTAWNYSVGLDVLAAVIERTARMPFDRFVRARILDPLRMNSTAFMVPSGGRARLADSVGRSSDGWSVVEPGATSLFAHPPSFPYGGAGLVSTARDYDRFLAMLQGYGVLDGVRILDDATARLAMSNLLPPGVRYEFNANGTPKADPIRFEAGFGAGGVVFTRSPPGWPSTGTFGWSGAAGTIAFVNAAAGEHAALMVNERPPDDMMQPDFYRAAETDLVKRAGIPVDNAARSRGAVMGRTSGSPPNRSNARGAGGAAVLSAAPRRPTTSPTSLPDRR